MLQQRKSTIIREAPVATKTKIGYDGFGQAMDEEDGVSKHDVETQINQERCS